MRTEDEIRNKIDNLNLELNRKPGDPLVEYSSYYKRKLKDWREALEWALNDHQRR